jgi:histidine triad (HIT) family protein
MCVVAPANDGHNIVVPKEHAPTLHALPMTAQRGVWALVSEVRGRLNTGLVPDGGIIIGCLDGLTAAVPVPHKVIHVVPRQAGEDVALPECSEWIADDGVVG